MKPWSGRKGEYKLKRKVKVVYRNLLVNECDVSREGERHMKAKKEEK